MSLSWRRFELVTGEPDKDMLNRRMASSTSLKCHSSRHVDTAQAYRNEAHVGTAFRESGLNRNEVFISTSILVTQESRRK